jgi:hypothetical protein
MALALPPCTDFLRQGRVIAALEVGVARIKGGRGRHQQPLNSLRAQALKLPRLIRWPRSVHTCSHVFTPAGWWREIRPERIGLDAGGSAAHLGKFGSARIVRHTGISSGQQDWPIVFKGRKYHA